MRAGLGCTDPSRGRCATSAPREACRKNIMNEKKHLGNGKRRRKRHSRFYCPQCLRKYRANDLSENEMCPHCKVETRCNTARIVAQVVTRLQRKRGIRPPVHKSDHELYIASSLWKEIRSRVLIRDNHLCLACGAMANVVHHRSYDREVMDGKRDGDLVSLCFGCHEAIEFTENNGRLDKNGLNKANNKLDAMIARRCGVSPRQCPSCNADGDVRI